MKRRTLCLVLALVATGGIARADDLPGLARKLHEKDKNKRKAAQEDLQLRALTLADLSGDGLEKARNAVGYLAGAALASKSKSVRNTGLSALRALGDCKQARVAVTGLANNPTGLRSLALILGPRVIAGADTYGDQVISEARRVFLVTIRGVAFGHIRMRNRQLELVSMLVHRVFQSKRKADRDLAVQSTKVLAKGTLASRFLGLPKFKELQAATGVN